MKITISILLLFVCFGCVVKKKSDKATFKASDFSNGSEGIYIGYDTNLIKEDWDAFRNKKSNVYWSSSTEKFYDSLAKAPYSQYDTQKVIMLVCDTVNEMQFKGESGWYAIEVKSNHRTHWQYGYKVTSKHGTGEIEYSYEDGKYVPYDVYDYDFVNYLDADKKQLSKSIIVWQTKELK